MVFSGDIYPSNYVLNKYEKDGLDGILSKNLQDEFTNAEISMANQEFSFSKRGTPMKNKQYTFRTDPKWVQILKDMQIDIVTLANNHTLDFGLEGLTDTFDTLNSSKIRYVGAGKNLSEAKETKYFKIKDKTIAVLGASRVIPVPEWNAGSNKPGLLTTYDPAALVNEIKAAKELSDYVVVYVHWGIEKNTKPEDYQRGLAKQYIDAGADLVVGSHPHVLQGIEYYNGVPIVYSLGNFMFYNSIEKTALLKATFSEDEGIRLQLIPCKASDACTYIVDDKKEKSAFYDYITKLSYDINFDENGFVQQ
jgi:poly-gamma-glutamate synthesis protein (capsule biosynthesis protein)